MNILIVYEIKKINAAVKDTHTHTYIYLFIQGVTGGTDQI